MAKQRVIRLVTASPGKETDWSACHGSGRNQVSPVAGAAPVAGTEGGGDGALGGGKDAGHGYVPPRLGRQRGDTGVPDATRDDLAEPGQVTVAVDGEAVHGDPAGHPGADGGDLAVRRGRRPRHPGAAAARHRPGEHAELGADPDQSLLDGTYVGNDVDRFGELDDGVSDELAGAVPGDLAA